MMKGDEDDGEDRLSSLPDILIFYILLRIPNTTLTQTTITTITLSKRWLALWTEFYNFIFQNPNNSFFPSALSDLTYVSQTLIQCRRSNLAQFHLSGIYNHLFKSHVNNWIRYAVNCNVKYINLTLSVTEYVLEEFLFVNSCFTRLNLCGCVFNPTGAISWNKLKRLCLSYTKLNEDMIENILSGCPVLETFELGYCNGYTLLDITSNSVKKLVVTGYGDCKADEHPDPDMLKINSPYILSLKIGGYLLVSNILLLNVSSLVEVNLNFNKCENGATIDENMSGLISSLHHVKELSIGILCNKVISRLQARGFTFPSNLKVLDSQDVTKSLIWPNTNVGSSNNRGWKYFHMRERSTSSLAGRISVKLLKSKTKVKDRISALPDALLIEILSRLPETKCAIRTSTLSKRWIHLWTYIPTLVFQRGYGNAFLASDFFPSIDKTLTQCRQLKLYKFELRCCHGYDIQFESQVKNWISYALNCNVEELYLELFSEGSEAEFVLDDLFYINSCITKLTLAGCIFIPTGAICWKKLKTLCIHRGIIDEDLIENIQRGSPMLETLELENCAGYMLLDITSKSVKNLIFSGYVDVDDVDIIEINAPNILSLKICGQLLLWKLVLLNVASLVNAHLDYSLDMDDNIEQEQMMLKQLILSLQHIKELEIGMTCFTPFFRLEAEGFEFPSNLKVLDSLEGISDWSDLNDSDEDSDLDSITNGD